MKHLQIAILLALLLASACVRPHYLSLEDRRQTNESLDYRIERKIIVAKVDSETSVIQAWLEIGNYTPDRVTITIDCRFYDNDFTPNEPITNKVRTITLEPCRFVPNHLPQWHYHHTTSAPGVAWLIAILFRPQTPKGIDKGPRAFLCP